MERMNSTSPADFRTTHLFHKDIVLVTVHDLAAKIINCKKRLVVFDQATNSHAAVIRRLRIYKKDSTLSRKKLCYETILNERNFCALINGSHSRNLRYSRHIFSPTVTVVTTQVSVTLMMTDTDYRKSTEKHAQWFQTLQKKLGFGGYWMLEQLAVSSSAADQRVSVLDDATTGSTVTLSLTDRRLSVLTYSDDDVVDTHPTESNDVHVQETYSINSIVCWKLHYSDRRNTRIAELRVVVAKDEDSAELERLRFRVTHDETIAKDISEVLSRIKLPAVQRAVRQRLPSQYLDLPDNNPRDTRYTDCEPHLMPRRLLTHRTLMMDKNRRSRDDIDLHHLAGRRQCLPPPPPRSQPHHHVLNSYDLNALSCADSVKDAVHFYENFGCARRRRQRRPPDVVGCHLDEDEEYWSIVFTLREILRKKTPEPDTLGLASRLRLKLCIILMDDSLTSWKNLAEAIGLTEEAVKMIETLFRWHTTTCDAAASPTTPTECILRHWQFIHNRWVSGAAGSTPPTHPCTLPSLINILELIGRHDLTVMLQTAARTAARNTPAAPASNQQ